ncbi:MAG TPA: hypothetical protein VFZ65_21845, partial [Planctomycetota bacterium]|nr:hypothetical protein [Planctomycetota bacterium]
MRAPLTVLGRRRRGLLAVPAAGLLSTALPAQVADWHRLPTPVGTASFGLAFDGARERMVLFESNGWNPVARTWERVGDVWS